MNAALSPRLHSFARRSLSDFGNKVFRATDAVFQRESLVRGGPIFDARDFAWTRRLEDESDAIREELDRVLAHRDALPSFQELSPAQKSIAKGDAWKVFPFYGFGLRSQRNCAICPRTAAAIDAIPEVIHAFFSILAPGAHIPRHHGITKGVVRCHLGLEVPRQAARCRMDVDGATVVWREGRTVVFDDSRPHEVWNDTDETRVVLLVDVPRPMTLRGRALLSVLSGVLDHTYYVREAIENGLAWERESHGLFERREAAQSGPASASARATRCPIAPKSSPPLAGGSLLG